MTSPARPGKTAPKLCQDFLIFDPLKGGKPNVLTDHSPPQGEGPQLAPHLASCKHDYTIKSPQSVTPPLDLRPDGGIIYKIAVICKKCRIHADIRIDYSDATDPCPTNAHPLHHFQRAPTQDRTTQDRIRYAWQCSVDECRAKLRIHFRTPRLSENDVNTVVNPELLKRRYHALLQEDPNREGIREATPMEGLSRLRRYVKDSLNPRHIKRQIPAINKRFQESFGLNGQDCHELLEKCGLKHAVSAAQGGQDLEWDLSENREVNWVLPNPEQIEDRFQTDEHNQREMLEDVEIELLAWMYKLSSEQGLVNPCAGESMSSANMDVERTLAAVGSAVREHFAYVTSPLQLKLTQSRFFNSLGALPDFSDSLIEYTYDRQTVCDPELQSYYFECLEVITEDRRTEQLQMKVAKLQSQLVVSRRDLTAAYRYFSISNAESQKVSDERVIEIFQARQSDLGAAAQEEARQHLYKIGVSRNSGRLISASRQSVDTYEDALSWLGNGADKNTSDEGILAVLAIKTADNPANEEIGQKAVATIAKVRKSNMLNNWLLTGRQDGYTMSVDEALRHLNIEQKLEVVDQTVLSAVFDSARQDRPGDTTEKAIAAIQGALASGNGNMLTHSPATWPVGLTSHGNTCYLNSLLQYYFSIKPLRDIVLNYHQYKLDTTNGEKKERVGQLRISTVEVEGGQRFAAELKYLFERMIKSRDSAVKPEADLVCRAFLKPKEYKLLDPIMRPEKDQPGQTASHGSESAVDDKFTDKQTVMSPTQIMTDGRKESDASSATLQASVNGDDPDVPMRDGEMPPTPPASPGLKGQEKPEPENPPPLPPRRFSTTKEEALAKAEANARQQQDVTEVHDAITFLLRCGMMPRGQDDEEEQEDAMRDLFSLRVTQTMVNKGVEQKPKPLPDSAIQLNVPYEPTDIYSALDAVFDLQPYTEDPSMEAFKSVKSLPPLLQINMPRIGYDKDRAGGAAFKSTECIRLEDELFLDRYLDTSHPSTLPKRRQCWGWRKQLQSLRREQRALAKTTMDLDGPSAVAETATYLTSLDDVNNDLRSIDVDPIEADGDITSALIHEAQQQAERVAGLDAEIDALQKQLGSQFQDLKNIKYRLAAVFFHRGSYGHGHYWIYIRDFANNIWRLYNDERVEQFDKLDSIFEAKTWDQGTPTYAVYVAEDKVDHIQPVCRDPEEAPTFEPTSIQDAADVEMRNVHSQQVPGIAIDPTLASEGGQASWDAPRQVAEDVKW
ncbi:ubiquitin-specific protease ubp2 [Vermiconidia calcicola]|uniref:Ubiquitin-specific protease ubp2 n=1 Tax=Vermiconidia calcicola TaxID=1690605 RepID=A0ACC3NPH3_9PEZI|nr:ubiquitin-specific protease ubp2 [Vermiconidia calcicola]